MKKLILPFALVLLLSFTAKDTPLTKEERSMAITEMTKTKNHLLEAVDDLTEAQLNYKSTPESWSIAECVEHIAISENRIFGMLQNTLKTPSDASRRSEVKMTDAQVIALLVDRSNKVKTREAFEPTGTFGSYDATLEAFTTKRAENMEFVMNTEDDLRNRYQQLPFGIIDSYQILLFMSAHTERHVRQIEEVMNNAGFPKQ